MVQIVWKISMYKTEDRTNEARTLLFLVKFVKTKVVSI